MSAKDIVKSFYNSDFLKDKTILDRFFHPDVEFLWNSTEGLTILHFDDIKKTIEEISRNYNDMRIAVSHVLEDDGVVTTRYKYYVRTVENPEEELGIAHFISIWHVKDGKLHRGYQVSQPVTISDDTNGSYGKVKV